MPDPNLRNIPLATGMTDEEFWKQVESVKPFHESMCAIAAGVDLPSALGVPMDAGATPHDQCIQTRWDSQTLDVCSTEDEVRSTLGFALECSKRLVSEKGVTRLAFAEVRWISVFSSENPRGDKGHFRIRMVAPKS